MKKDIEKMAWVAIVASLITFGGMRIYYTRQINSYNKESLQDLQKETQYSQMITDMISRSPLPQSCSFFDRQPSDSGSYKSACELHNDTLKNYPEDRAQLFDAY